MIRFGLLIFTGAIVWLATTEVATARLIFHDDFSTGDMSHHNANFRWGNGALLFSGEGADNVDRVTGPDGRSLNARRFRYGVWQEQRFQLTSSVDEHRTQNSPSDVAYQELWISYWMRVPENYHHRNSGGKAGHNNKGWLYLWKDGYEQWHSSWSDDATVTPTSLSLHWWPSSRAPGETQVSVISSRYRNNWGGRNRMTTCADERRIDGSTGCLAFLKSEHGRWVRYTFGMRAASSERAADGFMRIYADGQLAMSMEGLSGGGNGSRNGFDRGYIMGYHNSGYDERTTFYIADFRIGTTPESVGLDVSGRQRPQPPVLFADTGS
jgi:hypothetical protein